MATAFVADFRIYASDASLSRKDIIFGDVSSVLVGLGATDPRLSLIVPYMVNAVMKEDDVLILSAKSTGATGFDSGSVLRLPVTIKNMTTGISRQSFLGISDFTDMTGTAISGTDIVSVAGVWIDMIKYTVKPQERLILGHNFAENSRVYGAFTTT
jgi:hypothetical protein